MGLIQARLNEGQKEFIRCMFCNVLMDYDSENGYRIKDDELRRYLDDHEVHDPNYWNIDSAFMNLHIENWYDQWKRGGVS
jgi:hypothetical protein